MNSGGSNNLSLKHQRFTPSGCKEIGIRKFSSLQRLKGVKRDSGHLAALFTLYFIFKLNKLPASH